MKGLLPFLLFLSLSHHGDDRGEIVRVQPDGKIIVAATGDYQRKADFVLLRYQANGNLDTSFGNQGKTVIDFGGRDRVYGMVMQPDGRIVLAGYSDQHGKSAVTLVSFLTNGKLDEQFGDKGKVFIPFDDPLEIHFLARKPNGKCVVVGFIGRKDQDFLIGQFLPNGFIDKSFGQQGWVRENFSAVDRLYGLTLQSDGQIIVAGSIQNSNGQDQCAVARYSDHGQREWMWAHNNSRSVCSSVILQKDGRDNVPKILAAGYSEKEKNNNPDFFLERLTSGGQSDSTFGTNGSVTTDFFRGTDIIHDLSVQNDGSIRVAGEYQSDKGKKLSGFALAQYSHDGKLISSFPLKPHSDPVQAASMDIFKNKIYLTGFANHHLVLMRY